MFESSGWSLSSPLRGSFGAHVLEFHVRLDKGMEESGDSLCSYPAGVRSFRMSLKDSPRISAHEVRFERRAYRIVFLLTSQQRPFPDQAKQ